MEIKREPMTLETIIHNQRRNTASGLRGQGLTSHDIYGYIKPEDLEALKFAHPYSIHAFSPYGTLVDTDRMTPKEFKRLGRTLDVDKVKSLLCNEKTRVCIHYTREGTTRLGEGMLCIGILNGAC